MGSRTWLGRASSLWYLLLFAVSATGVIWQLVLFLRGVGVVTEAGGALPGHGTLLIRFFSYFTTEANLLVAVTSAWLVLNPGHDCNVDRFGYVTVIRNGIMLNLVLVGVGALTCGSITACPRRRPAGPAAS